MGKIGIIINREYTTRVKKKSFILTTLLVPIFIAAVIVVPALITYYSNDSTQRLIAVTDENETIAPQLENSGNITYQIVQRDVAEQIKQDLKNSSKYYAVLEIGRMDSLNNAPLAIYANEQINLNLSQKIESDINNILRYNKLQSYDIPNLEDVVKNVQNGSTLKTIQISEKSEDKETSVISYMAIGYISSFIIYMFIFMFGSMVMRGVIEEKNNRIIEVIVSSVKPIQLMIDKIIGIALVALTQFLIWIALIAIIIGGVTSVIGSKQTTKLAQQSVQASPMGTTLGSDTIDIAQEISQTAENEDNMLSTIINSFGQMNILGIIGTFIIYFILGYLLYSSMFAAIGACVDNEADTQQLMFPITLPLILGLFIMLNAFQNPGSPIAVWGSIIPFTSPMVMVARYAYGVPTWQYILSITLLIGTFLLMAWISAKIYRIGILSYGKKATWKDIFKWLKFKD